MIVQDKLDRMSVVIIYDQSGTQQVFDLSRDILRFLLGKALLKAKKVNLLAAIISARH
jgi:hypothetical protein